MTGKEVAEGLVEICRSRNISQEEINSFIKHLTHEHRTHQQSVGSVLLQLFLEWSRYYHQDYYDLRNEQLMKIASKIESLLIEEEVAWKVNEKTRVNLMYI